MTYERLLKTRIIETCDVSDSEIAGNLRAARKDIATAEHVKSTDIDWAFNIAYNGILQTAIAYMYHEGYRPRGEGKHYNTFEFLKEALPKKMHKEIAMCQKLRKKRNRSVYGQRGTISETEADNIISFSRRFHEEISDLLPEKIIKMSEES